MLNALLRPNAIKLSHTTATRFLATSAAHHYQAKANFVGYVAQEPKRSSNVNGVDYCRYTVVTKDKFIKPKEGETPVEPSSSYFTIFAYGHSVERVSRLLKGSLVSVEASIRSESVAPQAHGGEWKNNLHYKHERVMVLRRPKDGLPDLEA
ncbi:hypothetical protein MNV49_002875 [Pseudohyphozyma bogoriensis]|nr:hypothetical protein MNV49_002875 [Pseudohyphozyma bogoriensis]